MGTYNARPKRKTELLSSVPLSDEDEIIESKIISSNTLRAVTKNGNEIIILHSTPIIIKYKNGITILSSGGWKTLTTKDRIQEYSDYIITQVQRVWYVSHKDKGWMYYRTMKEREEHKGSYIFYDGIQLKGNFIVSNVKEINLTKIDKQKSRIRNFVNLIDKRGIENLQPCASDCWDCSMKTKEGKTMGEISNSNHLLSHIQQKYIHGSLIVNAMHWKGYSDTSIRTHYAMGITGTFKQVLYEYLVAHTIEELS